MINLYKSYCMEHSIVQTIFLALFHEFKLVYLSKLYFCVCNNRIDFINFLLSDSFSFVLFIYFSAIYFKMT